MPSRRGGSNVFGDLGFEPAEAENLKIRADLMIEIGRLIEARGLTQGQAAKVFGVSQPRISDIVRGKLSLFSIDMLVSMLGRAGAHVSVKVVPQSRVA